MSNSAENLSYFCKVAFGHPARDVIPLKFQSQSGTSLCFGYCSSGPFMDASPVCQRAVLDAVDRLRSAGHRVEEFQFPHSFKNLAHHFYALNSADGWRFYLDKLSNEPREMNIVRLLRYASLPNWIKRLCSLFCRLVLCDSRAINIIHSIREKSALSMIKLQIEVAAIEEEFWKTFEKSGIDILLTPAHVLPATPLNSFGNIHFCAAYTFSWNLLNAPIGVLNSVKFDLDKDVVPGIWPRKFSFKDLFAPDLLEKVAQHFYNPRSIQGLPAGIQVIGRANQDETVLEAMELIERLVKSKNN